MRKSALLAMAIAGLVAAAIAAEKLDLKEVDLDALVAETQKSKEPTEGMNIVWWVPVEFWEASLLQDDSISARERAEAAKTLRPYFLLAVVRADISLFGVFKFHDRKSVAASLSVKYVAADGKARALEPTSQVGDDVKVMLESMKPMFSAAFGKMGENFHFFVYSNRDKAGNTLVSPYEKGKLVVDLKKTPGEAGGALEFEPPLNSLFVPRKCTQCGKEAHISWNYCPWCGKRLPE